MPLYVIEKYVQKDNQTQPVIQYRSRLSEQQKLFMIDYFVYQKELEHHDKQAIFNLCSTLHERDLWVVCDCIKTNSRPIFRFKRSVAGKLFIHHINSKGAHSIECPFKESTARKSRDSSSFDQKINTNNVPLYLLAKKSRNLTHVETNASKINNSQETQSQKSSLCRALYLLLEKAGVNELFLEKKENPIAALKRAASSIELIPHKNLCHYLYLGASNLYQAIYSLKADTGYWGDYRKHALLLVKASDFDSHHIHALLPNKEIKTIKISNRIKRHSGRTGKLSMPYMALIMISDSVEKPGFFEPQNAFIVPCYSEKSFIPIDSHYERLVLKQLFLLQMKNHADLKPFSIKKPLFNLPIRYLNTTQYVRPDFIMTTSDLTIAIEVNGSNEALYLSRKIENTPILKTQFNHLIQINIHHPNPNLTISEAIQSIINLLRNPQ